MPGLSCEAIRIMMDKKSFKMLVDWEGVAGEGQNLDEIGEQECSSAIWSYPRSYNKI